VRDELGRGTTGYFQLVFTQVPERIFFCFIGYPCLKKLLCKDVKELNRCKPEADSPTGRTVLVGYRHLLGGLLIQEELFSRLYVYIYIYVLRNARSRLVAIYLIDISSQEGISKQKI
jgi:hypothetical protein